MTDVMGSLEGREHGFQGVDGNTFALDGVLYEAIEDPSDGYRSYLGAVRAVGPGIMFGRPVARVTVREVHRDGFNGWWLVDGDGHAWLRIGTDWHDHYYPCFVFSYDPPRKAR